MRIQITVEAGLPDALARDLHEWLRAETEAWSEVQLHESAPVPGALGPVADTVALALSSVASVSSLASVIVAWLQYRKPDTGLRIVIEDRRTPVVVSGARAQSEPEVARSALTTQLTEVASTEPDSGDAG
jgi:hypothetical protein